MAPILGIYASQISGHLFAPSGAYDSIATVTVGAGGTSTVTFSSIPATYKHLQLRTSFNQSSGAGVALTINSGSFARRHYLYGDGSSAVAGSDTLNDILAITSVANVQAANIIDILDYTSTNKTKTYRILGGSDTNGAGTIIMFSALDLSTSAINSITLSCGSSFTQNSKFALYGIKGD